MKKTLMMIACAVFSVAANAQSTFDSDIEQVDDSTLVLSFKGKVEAGWKIDTSLDLTKLKGVEPIGTLTKEADNTYVQKFRMLKNSYTVNGTFTHTPYNDKERGNTKQNSFEYSAKRRGFSLNLSFGGKKKQ